MDVSTAAPDPGGEGLSEYEVRLWRTWWQLDRSAERLDGMRTQFRRLARILARRARKLVWKSRGRELLATSFDCPEPLACRQLLAREDVGHGDHRRGSDP